MAEATDIQMQTFVDQRVRRRAEGLRSLVAELRDDKAAINDEYSRAAGTNPWNDANPSGPPKLATQQDVLTFNAVITALLACIDGTATLADVATLHSNWAAFQTMCRVPI